MPYVQKPPVTKRDLMNRMLSHDFDGDLRNLGEGARISRVSGNTLELRFDNIDRTFLLSVHIPREEKVGKQPVDDFAAPLPTTRRAGKSQ